MHNEAQLHDLFSQLSKEDILTALVDIPLRAGNMRTRAALFQAVCEDVESQERVAEAVIRKRQRVLEDDRASIKRVRLNEDYSSLDHGAEAQFLSVVGEDVRRSCVERFIDRTSEHDDLVSCEQEEHLNGNGR